MPFQNLQRRPGRWVPEPDCAVIGCRRYKLAVRREYYSNSQNWMPCQSLRASPCRHWMQTLQGCHPAARTVQQKPNLNALPKSATWLRHMGSRAWSCGHKMQTAKASPSGENTTATHPIWSEWPSEVCSVVPVDESQSLTMLSSDSDATSLPFGESTNSQRAGLLAFRWWVKSVSQSSSVRITYTENLKKKLLWKIKEEKDKRDSGEKGTRRHGMCIYFWAHILYFTSLFYIHSPLRLSLIFPIHTSFANVHFFPQLGRIIRQRTPVIFFYFVCLFVFFLFKPI